MYKLYSERIRNKDGEPEVYSYDEFPEAFRNQVFYIIVDVLEGYSNEYGNQWDKLFKAFAREKGAKLDIEEVEWGNFGRSSYY